MRNPQRIDKFCSELAEVWKTECPDWRFGQFIMNVLNSFNIDPWFLEEDEMMEQIKQYFNPTDKAEV